MSDNVKRSLALAYFTLCSLATAFMLRVLEIEDDCLMWGAMFMFVFTVLPIVMHSLPSRQEAEEYFEECKKR